MTRLMIHVINKDGKANTFHDQSEDFINDLMNAVTQGTGFSLWDNDTGIMLFGPGTVARVGIVDLDKNIGTK